MFISLASNTALRGSALSPVEDTLSTIENVLGGTGADQITGSTGVNVIDGGDSNDIIIGGRGNDNLIGGLGDDTFRYDIGDGADTLDGGAGTDALQMTGTTSNDTLNVVFNGSSLTGFAGGSLTSVESATVDLGGGTGTDTLSYAGTTVGVTVDLGAGTAFGFAAAAAMITVCQDRKDRKSTRLNSSHLGI